MLYEFVIVIKRSTKGENIQKCKQAIKIKKCKFFSVMDDNVNTFGNVKTK
jgi:hypothetical protein